MRSIIAMLWFGAVSSGMAWALLAAEAPSSDSQQGFVPLFNGKDLSGWQRVNVHPDTFQVREGKLITTGNPIGFLRTEKQYENFILEMEWMHVNKDQVGNSGLFVWADGLPAVGSPFTRGIEVQVLVNFEADWATSHGDVFSVSGAFCKPDRPHPKGYQRCLPSERRAKGGGEWNHYKIIANNGTIKLHVNGKEVSGVSECRPRKGYLALESEGAECHFRNLRIQELPSTHPQPQEIAFVADGYQQLFSGLDLVGWDTPQGAWKPVGGNLKSDGSAPLTTAVPLTLQEFLFDFKLPPKSSDAVAFAFGPSGKPTLLGRLAGDKMHLEAHGKKFAEPRGKWKPGAWQRLTVRELPREKKIQFLLDGQLLHEFDAASPLEPGMLRIEPANGLEIRNLYALGRTK